MGISFSKVRGTIVSRINMISLSRIVEQHGAEGQYYDLGKDFANFRRMIDGADDQIKKQYEKAISAKLVGKRINARASRGYKQFVKNYEFDVTKVTIDDYYDNFVIVAYDNTTPKPREYFLKSGFKVTILGPATGQPSPQKGGKPKGGPSKQQPGPYPPQANKQPDAAQHQPMALAPAGKTPTEEPLKEEGGYYDAYPIDNIAQDIKAWLPSILLKPNTALRDFVTGLGWQKDLGHGTSVAMFDIKVPADIIKPGNNVETLKRLVSQSGKQESTIDTKYDVVKLDPDEAKGEWNIRIKKTMKDKTV